MKRFVSKAILLLALLLLPMFPQLLLAQAPVVKEWDKGFGGSDLDYLTTIIVTPDGGYLLGGSSMSGANGDKSEPSKINHDYWIVKLNADGDKEWDKAFGGRDYDYLTAMTTTPDGGYLLGGWSYQRVTGDLGDYTGDSKGLGDYWVIKLNSDGSKDWVKSFGGRGHDALTALTPTADGGYLLGGISESSVNGDKSESSKGVFDYWIVRIDANGNKEWDKTYGGGAHDNLTALTSTPDGGFLLGGRSNSNAGGDKTEDAMDNDDYWVVKLNADGTKAWDRTLGGSGFDRLWSLAVTADNCYLLGGYSSSPADGNKTEASKGSTDFWVVKLKTDGSKAWDRTIGGNGQESLNTMITSPDGGYLLGGFSESGANGDKSEASRGGSDFWIVKLNADGSKAWDKTYGWDGEDNLLSMTVTPEGSYLLGGSSSSGAGFDKSDVSKGEYDYWVIKLSPTTLSSPLSAGNTQRLTVYPNPSSRDFHVQLPDLTPGKEPTELVLYNTLGQQVLRQQVKATDLQAGILVSTTTLSSGTYYLQLRINDQSLTRKLILR